MKAVTAPPRAKHNLSRALWLGLGLALALYVVIAYLVMPAVLRRDMRMHPALEGIPTLTYTSNDVPGDPLNIGLVGSEAALQRAMLAAHWYPADPITLENSLRIAADTVMRRGYDDAPVSDLFLFGRKQDLAFEQPVGPDPKQRHHVRFWRSPQADTQLRPLWIGSATFDVRVGLSHDSGQITHHIGPDIDAERDRIIDELRALGKVIEVRWIDGFQEVPDGKNGGGDPYHTDGRLAVGVLVDPG